MSKPTDNCINCRDGIGNNWLGNNVGPFCDDCFAYTQEALVPINSRTIDREIRDGSLIPEPVEELARLRSRLEELVKVWTWQGNDWPSGDMKHCADELAALLAEEGC